MHIRMSSVVILIIPILNFIEYLRWLCILRWRNFQKYSLSDNTFLNRKIQHSKCAMNVEYSYLEKNKFYKISYLEKKILLYKII